MIIIFFILSFFFNLFLTKSTVGYQIGNIQSYTLLRTSNKSRLFLTNDDQIRDNKKIYLLQLIGTHYQAGYDYGALFAKEMVETYHTFLESSFSHQYQITILQAFLDWQYDTYIRKNIPLEFIQQLRGIQKGARQVHQIHNLRLKVQRTLTISSYPGNFSTDITYTLLDQFLRSQLHQNQFLLNYVQKNLFKLIKLFKDFHNNKRIHCSFFALWGSRTQGGKLLTMRNLDWSTDTGMNKFKLVTVWKIEGKIPHATIGFPVIIGALTGMSAAGLTVHQAGLDSMRATQIGFPWTLRLRYIMMNAKNLQQAKKLWNQTKNTLGMNHMIASAGDVVTGQPAFVIQTMRDYNAWFKDHDSRQDQTIFIDPKTKNKFRAGFAMKQAVFRTNHAYDPIINWYRSQLPTQNGSTMKRYLVMKDAIKYQENLQSSIDNYKALNITSIVAHKGGKNAYLCPGQGDKGTNVISVMFSPGEMRMFVGFQYGAKQTYKTGCCGVYVDFDMKKWFQNKDLNQEELQNINQN